MPYEIQFRDADAAMLDRLIELGALDVDASGRGLAAVMPDSVTPAEIARALGGDDFVVSPATARDAGSVWVLRPRPVRVSHHEIALIDSPVFGTGLHPTTALCLEAIEDEIRIDAPGALLDVGTGSGVLAIASLKLGVPRATAIDTDPEALRVAAENARLNDVGGRLELVPGGPEAIDGAWPLAVANVLAAPLVEMAPVMVRRIGHHGRLILSGIPASLDAEVVHAYRHLGMRHVSTRSRAGWVALLMQASW